LLTVLKYIGFLFKIFIIFLSIALNPQIQSKNLIATAGRDKYIRIWDWSKNMPQFLYTVEMMAIVTRVSWCPDNSWYF
jgi:WD40 repeat protein